MYIGHGHAEQDEYRSTSQSRPSATGLCLDLVDGQTVGSQVGAQNGVHSAGQLRLSVIVLNHDKAPGLPVVS
jgi:hypothetical protein